MMEYGSTTVSGRYAEYPQLTDFDLNRSVKEILSEIAKCCGWSEEKAKDAWDFGVRNVRQGEFAREREYSPKKCLGRLRERIESLCYADKGSEAKALSVALRAAKDDDDAIVEIAKEVWPPAETPADFQRLIGAEASE